MSDPTSCTEGSLGNVAPHPEGREQELQGALAARNALLARAQRVLMVLNVRYHKGNGHDEFFTVVRSRAAIAHAVALAAEIAEALGAPDAPP